MSQARPSQDRCIDYVEFQVEDIARQKAFYGEAFGWSFTDYGLDYCEFDDGRMKGGFERGTPLTAGGPLVVLYSDDLPATMARIEAAGGTVTRSIFGFPGGERFHFRDPAGYELAVWTAADPD